MLSKLTMHTVGTPSASGVNWSSETRPRCVLVRAATTTDPIRFATGSRVSTRTGLSPPGVFANQTSPFLIGPFTPVLGGPPVGDLCEALLIRSQWLPEPCLHILLSAEADEIPVEGITEELRPIDAETLCPPAGFFGLGLVDSETEHCHTASVLCMTDRIQDLHLLPRARSHRTWFDLEKALVAQVSPSSELGRFHVG